MNEAPEGKFLLVTDGSCDATLAATDLAESSPEGRRMLRTPDGGGRPCGP